MTAVSSLLPEPSTCLRKGRAAPWRGTGRITAARDAGFDVVACPNEHLYFDFPETGVPAEPSAFSRVPRTLNAVRGYRPENVHGMAGHLRRLDALGGVYHPVNRSA